MDIPGVEVMVSIISLCNVHVTMKTASDFAELCVIYSVNTMFKHLFKQVTSKNDSTIGCRDVDVITLRV